MDDLTLLAGFLRVSGLATTLTTWGGSPLYHIPGVNMDVLYQLRTKCSGIGSEKWLTNWASAINTPDRECASYRFSFYCVRELRRSQATDPRDKVFRRVWVSEEMSPRRNHFKDPARLHPVRRGRIHADSGSVAAGAT
ncbi:hypothetical protein W97_05495 [Coniosporium apollinis CBS 100218]|uniref:Uncharacterized protein n=1 Tax=Coniosporium apollinis (strain CBS 100218) TaxID=1168221 RepID=R7YX28_CONA1|nr:uncharacterized protein W97_05495 [Coniosporium apollinis CBS 100218]EON66398.1 hypothetical protein W97_05495 [Coniosporium apollinis CBS 100218]